MAGYFHIQNADVSACLVFCRRDDKCTSFVYSKLAPPLKGSYCRFYSNAARLTLREPEKNSPTGQSHLIILESGVKEPKKTIYGNAFLNGNHFLTGSASPAVSCGTACLKNPFCAAVGIRIRIPLQNQCFFYSRQDITAITYKEDVFTQLFM